MATDKKISELTVATTPTGSELIEIVQGGVNKQTTLQAVADLAADEHFLGVYTDETALTTAHATANPGDYAYIDAGIASPVEMWIWDDDDDEWVQSGGAAGGTWGSITGTLSSQTDLVTAINAKVADAINDGTTTIAPSQNAVFDALALKAPLASPTFTGTPAAPTAAAGTNSTQLATTAYADRKVDNYATIKTETASHTLDADDLSDVNAGKQIFIHMNVAGANDLIIPPNSTRAFTVGSIIFITQIGAGQTTIVAGSGVTIRNPDGLILASQYAQAAVRKIGTDEWIATGMLKI